jgi:hypothetical protein
LKYAFTYCGVIFISYNLCHCQLPFAILFYFDYSPPRVIYTEDEMPFVEFRRRAELMLKVNETIPKALVPGVSRPTFRELRLSPEVWTELKEVFFGEDGKLRDSIMNDVAINDHTVFINFKNIACRNPRNDQRWQIQFRHHSDGGKTTMLYLLIFVPGVFILKHVQLTFV